MTRTKVLSVAIAGLLLCGFARCGGGGPTVESECEDGAAPEGGGLMVVLGKTVDGEFVPLEEDEALPLTFGSQGGQHMYVSLRAYGTSGASWDYELNLRDEETTEDLGSGSVIMPACAPGWTITHNARVFVSTPTVTSGRLEVSASLLDSMDVPLGAASTEQSVRVVQ